MRFRWGPIGLIVNLHEMSVSVPYPEMGDNVWRTLFALKCALCARWFPRCDGVPEGAPRPWLCRLRVCGLCDRCYTQIQALDDQAEDEESS